MTTLTIEKLDAPQPRKDRPKRTVASTLATIFGSFVFIALLLGFVLAAFYKPVENVTLTHSVEAIEEVRVYPEGGSFEVEYGNVEEATLEVTRSSGGWRMEQLDNVLFVTEKTFLNVCFDECVEDSAKLILPEKFKERAVFVIE